MKMLNLKSLGKVFVISVLILSLFNLSVMAKGEDDIKASLSFKEIAFIINVLNSIELKGEEVSPFIEIMNVFTRVFKKWDQNKTDAEAQNEIKMSRPMTQNFLLFFQRARLKGVEASLFYDITTKLIDSAKK